MNISISNEIEIKNPTEGVKKWCEHNLVYNNPDYIRKKKMGFWLGSTPKKIYMYKIVGGDKYVLPFGVVRRLWRLIKKANPKVNFKFNKIHPVSRIELYDYQEKAVEEMLKARNGVLVSKAGSGKGHPLDTILYTPNGKVKLGDLKIGDKLIGSNGKPIKVTNIFDRGILDTYKVTFTDDTFIECDGDHLFTVQTRNHRSLNIDKWQTLSVNELKEKINKNSRRYHIPIVEPVNFEHKEVELDAWLLGALLGDGGFTNNFISFSNSEKDILNKVQEKLPNGDCLKHKLKNDYCIKKTKTGKDKPKTLQAIMKYGLINKYSYEKHIPDEYKYNDINTRLEVLRGLIDTDGSVASSKESVDITTTSKQLALDIVEIVQSLGGTAKIRIRHTKYTYNGEKKNGRESYRVYIKLYKYLPFSSEKHTQKYVERKKYLKPYRIIKNIEYVGKKEIRCISVDAEDKLYVAKDFIVTHNTQMMLELICRLGLKALWINNKKDLLNQALDRAKANIFNCTFGTITEGRVNIGDITFSTIQTLAKIDLASLKDEFSIVIYDEVQNASRHTY